MAVDGLFELRYFVYYVAFFILIGLKFKKLTFLSSFNNATIINTLSF